VKLAGAGPLMSVARTQNAVMITPTAADLAAMSLFASLSSEELRDAAQLFSVRVYPKGAIVATEGDRLDLFNVILSGRIQWFWSDEAGRQLKLHPEGPGGHFADTTLGGEPILMSVIALEPVRVASIPMAELKRLLLRHPELAVALLMDVVGRLRRLLQTTKTLTMEEVYGRVVKLLLARAVDFDGKLVAEHLTHAEIGHRVGATREMVGRVLRDLARGGYIETARGRITILRKPPRRW
jgi:CRP/FNR family transcriptional regulator, cyclic AMP receptor protein